LWAILFVNPLLLALAAASQSRARRANVQTVTVRMRQCRGCAKSQPVKPVRVDYDRCEMRLVVHRDFKSEFSILNEQRDETATT
jgi:hypothetical protein